ncbi:RIP metalloprotease RseP [Granulicella sp. WH15]|nr:RIP metalloprotease RseP [Granulicella sp. WH15]
MVTVLLLLLVLGVMVLVHEFGHFAVAKLCGIRVEVFSIGFGKRLLGFRSGDTDYRLSLLPLGGYVKMSGDNPGEAPTGDPGEFNAHPRWQRGLVAIAGPVANLVLAFIIMLVVYMNHHEVDYYLAGPAQNDYALRNSPAAATGIHPGDTIVRYDHQDNPDWETILNTSLLNLGRTVDFSYEHDGQRTDSHILVAGTQPDPSTADVYSILKPIGLVPQAQNVPVAVTSVAPDSPASTAGLQPGDQISAIDGVAIHSVPALLAYLQDQGGKRSALTVVRSGAAITVGITPKLMPSGDGTDSYRLGFIPVRPLFRVNKLSFGAAARESWKTNLKSATLIKDVLMGMFQRRVSPKNLSGPIGIGQQVGIAARDSIWSLFTLMAVISMNLAIFNLLPFPVLDGGLISLLGIEGILRRDINQQVKDRIYQVAFVCILLFAAMVIFNDISRLPHHLKM